MLRPFLVDAGLTMAEIGWLLGTAGFTAGLLGALAGGALVIRLGRVPSLLLFGALQACSVALYSLPAFGLTSQAMLYAVCTLEHFAGGMATAALFTMMMDVCRRESAATDYTLQASVVVLATGVLSALSGFSAEALGYGGHFLCAGACCLIGLGLIWKYVTPRSPVGALVLSGESPS